MGSMVPMISPDGQSGDIPAERVQDAVSAGFKAAVVMTAPDGSTGYIPHDRAMDAIKAGFKMGQATAQERPKEGALSAMGGDLLNTAKGLITAGPITGGIQALKQGYDDLQSYRQTGKTQGQLEDEQRQQAGHGLPYRVAARANEALGVNVPGMEQAAVQGDTAGVVGHAVAGMVPYVLPEVAKHVIPPVAAGLEKASPRGILADRMAEVPAGERFSRQEVLDAARAKGVNLDLAQATDSKIIGSIKKANEHSIAASSAYDSNREGNLSALEGWANGEAEKYSPNQSPREQVGAQLQQALKEHLAQRKAIATEAFQELDRAIGKNAVDASGVQQAAREIVDENKQYYDKHSELQPKQAWSVVKDLADEKSAAASWTELHQLRSDLMDFYRNNPDVVKGRSEAWIQQMVGKIDESMTSASKSGLTGDQLSKFRQANQVWESIKNTYDNPRSPYYQAVRSMTPSNLPANLANSPELAKQVRATLGSLEGPFQRQFVENIINDKSGKLDLKNLNQRLSRTHDDVLRAMVGDEGAKQLRLLGKVAQKVTADSNPSGSAKAGIAAGEVVNLFHNPIAGAAELGTQYGVGKGINSPRAIDFLTKKKP